MVGGGVVARPSEPRVSTGNRSLDEMLEGGLVAHRPYLIVGPSGTGKTTLAIQFLCEGVRRHERVLLVTLEEPPNEARVNHRGLEPDLDRVEVFDAIPDIMRYERTPFKDIASVRSAIAFGEVPLRIRQSPELASVEVTITALEQMLRTEVIRRGYTRIVIDSLTALQYFCMKGFDPVAGAQSFLRFLSDLRVTTLLTVESPLEDIETPERMLARGEVRLFRWELDGQTVRAVGVEKFRGSSHDVRLHPYRIGPQGIAINLDVTISRDTRQIIEPLVPTIRQVTPAAPEVAPLASPVTPLVDEVRDLILLGADVAPARSEIESALRATTEGHPEEAQAHLSRVTSLVMVLVDHLSRSPSSPGDPTAVAALQRVLARGESIRTGVPPTSLPAPTVLQVQLGALLSLLPPPTPPPVPEVVPPPTAPAAPPEPVAETLPPVAAEPEVVESSPTSIATEPEAATPAPAPVDLHETAEAAVESVPAVTVEPAPSATVESTPAATSGPAPATKVEPAPSAPSVPTAPALPSVSPPTIAVAVPPPTPAPEPEPPRRTRSGRGLPPPPKPRAPILVEYPKRSATAPAPREAAPVAEPPPLPTTKVPDWSTMRGVPAPSAARTGAPATPAHPAHPPVSEPPARPPASRVKKRRRAAAAALAAKKAPGHGRATASDLPGSAEAPTPPLLPRPASPGGPGELPSAPKPRRRSARKRKAPPVVSVAVEPIPPGVFGKPDDGAKPSGSEDAPSTSEE